MLPLLQPASIPIPTYFSFQYGLEIQGQRLHWCEPPSALLLSSHYPIRRLACTNPLDLSAPSIQGTNSDVGCAGQNQHLAAGDQPGLTPVLQYWLSTGLSCEKTHSAMKISETNPGVSTSLWSNPLTQCSKVLRSLWLAEPFQVCMKPLLLENFPYTKNYTEIITLFTPSCWLIEKVQLPHWVYFMSWASVEDVFMSMHQIPAHLGTHACLCTIKQPLTPNLLRSPFGHLVFPKFLRNTHLHSNPSTTSAWASVTSDTTGV